MHQFIMWDVLLIFIVSLVVSGAMGWLSFFLDEKLELTWARFLYILPIFPGLLASLVMIVSGMILFGWLLAGVVFGPIIFFSWLLGAL